MILLVSSTYKFVETRFLLLILEGRRILTVRKTRVFMHREGWRYEGMKESCVKEECKNIHARRLTNLLGSCTSTSITKTFLNMSMRLETWAKPAQRQRQMNSRAIKHPTCRSILCGYLAATGEEKLLSCFRPLIQNSKILQKEIIYIQRNNDQF